MSERTTSGFDYLDLPAVALPDEPQLDLNALNFPAASEQHRHQTLKLLARVIFGSSEQSCTEYLARLFLLGWLPLFLNYALLHYLSSGQLDYWQEFSVLGKEYRMNVDQIQMRLLVLTLIYVLTGTAYYTLPKYNSTGDW